VWTGEPEKGVRGGAPTPALAQNIQSEISDLLRYLEGPVDRVCSIVFKKQITEGNPSPSRESALFSRETGTWWIARNVV